MHQKKSSLSKIAPLLTCASFGITIAIVCGATAAHAEVQVFRQSEDIRVDLRDADVSEVLGALGVAYDVPKNVKVDLAEPITGSYSGSPREIISHLLRRYDFVVKNSDGKLAVLIYGLSKTTLNVPAGTLVPGGTVANPAPAASAPAGSQAALGSGDSRSKNAAEPSSRNSIVDNSSQLPAPVDMSVGRMLGAAARGQIPASSAGNAAAAPVDMSTLTRSAASAVQNLAGALRTATTQMGSRQ